jgi:hypothetical protein
MRTEQEIRDRIKKLENDEKYIMKARTPVEIVGAMALALKIHQATAVLKWVLNEPENSAPTTVKREP